MTICTSLRLLIVLATFASLGISPLDPKALSGGHSEVLVLVLIDQAPEDGRDAVTPKQPRANEHDCGPTNTCVPVVFHPGDKLQALNLGPEREIDLPRLLVDLWRILPTAPIPIV